MKKAGILRNKKAHYFSEMWNPIRNILIIFLFVLLPVLGFITALSSSDYFEKNYLALDSGLVMDTIIASPNDLVYKYPRNTKAFTFRIREGSIRVYHKGMLYAISIPASSYFIGDDNLEIKDAELDPIIDVDGEEIPESILPLQLIIMRYGDTISFKNAKEDIIDE